VNAKGGKVKRLRWGCIAFVVFLFLVGSASFVGSNFHYKGLIFTDTMTVQGVVDRTEPTNHSFTHYRYEVEGELYRGFDSAEGYERGDHLEIAYSPEDPRCSVIQEVLPSRSEFLISWLAGTFVVSTLGAVVMAFAVKQGAK